MNLLKKGIGALLLAGLMMSSCDDDAYVPIAPTGTSGGETTSIFSSFSATASGDGTIITVTPLSVGVDSFVVDFGAGSGTVTISEQGGTASYDYPNEVEEVDYTITVTTKAEGQSDITKTREVTVTHSPIALSSRPASPTGSHHDVFAIFSDGIEFDGGLLAYREKLDDVTAKITGLENTVLEFSRLSSEAGVLAFGKGDKPENVVVAEAFGSPANDDPVGVGATQMHLDVHSVFAEGIDKLKITLINGDTDEEYVLDGIDLTDGDWAGFDYDLATDFSAPVVRIDEIKFELGTGGTANDHATINVDNITLTKAPSATILNGGFDLSTAQWKPATFY